GEGNIVDDGGLANYLRVLSEPALPVPVSNHCSRSGSGFVILGRKSPAQHRFHTQSGVVAARNQLAGGYLRLAIHADVELRQGRKSEDCGKRLVVIANALKGEIRERSAGTQATRGIRAYSTIARPGFESWP